MQLLAKGYGDQGWPPENCANLTREVRRERDNRRNLSEFEYGC